MEDIDSSDFLNEEKYCGGIWDFEMFPVNHYRVIKYYICNMNHSSVHVLNRRESLK